MTKRITEPKNTTIEPISGSPAITEALLKKFEEEYGCKLPDEFRRFMLQYNGGFPDPDCVTFKEAGRQTVTDVCCFHSIGDDRPWASLEWHVKTFAGRLPSNTLPIAHDSCGNLWLLNVGPTHSGTILFWDHGTFDTFDETDVNAWPVVADSFQAFLDHLHNYSSLPEEEALLSRYALVQRAIDGMSEKEPSFGKRTALGWAWHCHYEDGSVTMQYVDYAVHAAATHTDGYSDLRAAKGFIKTGPPRLPR